MSDSSGSSKGWHYEKSGQRVGPFRAEDVPQLVRAGIILPDTTLIDQSGNRLPASTVAASDVSTPAPSATSQHIEEAPQPIPDTMEAERVIPPPPETRSSRGWASRDMISPMFCGASLLIGILLFSAGLKFDLLWLQPVACIAFFFAVLAFFVLMSRGIGRLLKLSARAAGILGPERVVEQPELSPFRSPNAEASPNQGLGRREYTIYSALFLFIPVLCVAISSILYYCWKSSQPRKARQINTLGFIVFGLQIGIWFLYGYFASDRAPSQSQIELHRELRPKFVVNGSELYYFAPVSEADAERLGKFLVSNGIADGQRKTFELARQGDTHQLRMVAKPGAENDQLIVDGLSRLTQELSQGAFDGAPVEIHLCDDYMKTVRVVPWPGEGLGRKLMVEAVELFYQPSVSEEVAQKLADYIRKTWADNEKKTLELRKPGEAYQFRLVVKEGFELDDATAEALTNDARELSREVFGGVPVEIHLCNSSFSRTLKIIPWKAIGSEVAPGSLMTNSIQMKLALIPAGEFLMGSPEADKDASSSEKPQHRVRITKPFYLGIHEVTVAEFRQFVDDSDYETESERDEHGAWGLGPGMGFRRKLDCTWKNPGFTQTDDYPVVTVSWNDAVAFCEWLSRKEEKTYRLPMEAEWEYACRAGTTTIYCHGDDPEGLTQVGNVPDAAAKKEFPDWNWCVLANDGYAFTAPVGRFKANAFGLHDIHGNVWEWCGDWYDDGYFQNSPADDPIGPSSGTTRVRRGGSWADSLRAAS